MVAGPDGSVYFVSSCPGNTIRIWRVDVDGKLRIVAGTGAQGCGGDGLPAKDVPINWASDMGLALTGASTSRWMVVVLCASLLRTV